jgi:hypothetical protein
MVKYGVAKAYLYDIFFATKSFFLEQPEEDNMRRITLMLFQLFLGLFAGYAILYDLPNEYLIVPLICLVCMYFLGRHKEASPKTDQEEVVADA